MSSDHSTPSQTVGGVKGRFGRRLVHVFMPILPIIYHYWGVPVASCAHMYNWQIILVLLGIFVVLEIVRIYKGVIIFGQRQHEAHHISSMMWGAIGMSVAMLLAPQTVYAIVIVTCCAVVDPLLGELRGAISTMKLILIAMLVVGLIWWVSSIWIFVPWWWPFILAPVTIAAEWPSLHWIDDNALMMLVPLFSILILFYI